MREDYKYRDCQIIINALNNGNHDEELEFLKKAAEDSELFFGIRHNKLQLYKSRAMVVEVSYIKKEDRLVYKTNTTEDIENRNESREVTFKELKEQFTKDVKIAKNKYRDRGLFEEICQQWIVDMNNKYSDDYYYVDMEFNIQGTRLGRIDMIAISRKKIDGKHRVILIELKVGKQSISGTWKFDDNHKNDKDIESRIFNCDLKHPLKYGHGIVGHIVDYYRLISDENYNIIKTNICKMLKCQKQLGYLNDIQLANTRVEDLSDEPEVLIACYTYAPRSSYDSSNDEENNQPVSIDELKREVHKCLYKEIGSAYNLETALPYNMINGFMDIKTDEPEKWSNTLTIEQLLNNKKYAFTIKFIDAAANDCWNCI